MIRFEKSPIIAFFTSFMILFGGGKTFSAEIPYGTSEKGGYEILYKAQKSEKGETFGLKVKTSNGQKYWIYSQESLGSEITIDDNKLKQAVTDYNKKNPLNLIVAIELSHMHTNKSEPFKISPPSLTDIKSARIGIVGLQKIATTNSVIDNSFIWRIEKQSNLKTKFVSDQDVTEAYNNLASLFPIKKMLKKKWTFWSTCIV